MTRMEGGWGILAGARSLSISTCREWGSGLTVLNVVIRPFVQKLHPPVTFRTVSARYMHVFRVQTRVKHTMRLEKAGAVFLLSLNWGQRTCKSATIATAEINAHPNIKRKKKH